MVTYEVGPFLELIDELDASSSRHFIHTEIDESESEGSEIFEETNIHSNMAQEMSITEFMRLAASTINKNYAGDPLTLESYLSSTEFSRLVTPPAQEETLLRFIQTKLDANAYEAVPRNAQNVDTIIDALRSKIEPENSKIIAGRMMALRLDKKQILDYSKQAEELSDAFRRSLVMECITQDEAIEMTIDKTIDMCRASTSSYVVKAILGATTFKGPKEVIATLTIETGKDIDERQVLAYQKYTNNYSKQSNRGNTY